MILEGGITSKYSLLNARSGDGNSSLDVGVKQIHQGSWNTIAGLRDHYNYSVFISQVSGTDTLRHPYTGDVLLSHPFLDRYHDCKAPR